MAARVHTLFFSAFCFLLNLSLSVINVQTPVAAGNQRTIVSALLLSLTSSALENVDKLKNKKKLKQ